MIIVDQTRTLIVNMNDVTAISTDNARTGREIAATKDGLQITLGKYKSKKRANEILKHIYSSYSASEMYRCTGTAGQEELAKAFLEHNTIPFVVEMPLE